MTKRPGRRHEPTRSGSSGSSGPRGRRGPGRAARQARPATVAAGPDVAKASGKVPGKASAKEGPSSRLTSRAAILVLVVAVLMVSYASSMKAFLQQRTHINDLQGQIAQRQDAIDDLEAEKARWSDPAYVEQQARARLGYVMPGEKSYLVLDENGEALRPQSDLDDPSEVLSASPAPWWSGAWASVELAGDPPKAKKPPAAEIDGSNEKTELD